MTDLVDEQFILEINYKKIKDVKIVLEQKDKQITNLYTEIDKLHSELDEILQSYNLMKLKLSELGNWMKRKNFESVS
jgi:hypothetical protein